MKELSLSEYKKLARPSSFMQAAQMAKQRKAQGQTTYFFQHKNQFALINGTPYPNKTSKHFSYNAWFPDQLSSDFVKQLRTWCKRNNGLSLTITPNTPASIRDYHGKVIKKLKFDKTILTKNKFKWQGKILLAPGTYKQWQYILDLNKPYSELLKSFKPKVRHSIATTKKVGLSVKPLTAKNIKVFTETLSATADRRHFSARNQQYYQSMLDAFGDSAYGLIAYLDPSKTRKLLQTTIKNSVGIKDGADIIRKAERQLEIIKNLKQSIPIYAGFFIDTSRETVYLAGGGPDQYLSFSPVYAILDQAMQHSINNNISRFNLYGVDATFDKPTGLLRFKQQFHGIIEQLPGDYTTNLRPLTSVAIKVRNRLKNS